MKNKVFAALLVTLIAARTGARAEDASGGFKLKNQSSFSTGGAGRDPFWPIGWVKSSASISNKAAAAAVTLKPESFVVTSILLNNPPLAVINGKDMMEGELAQFQIENQTVVVQLAAVQDGQVVLRCHDHNIVVPLHRKAEPPAAVPASGAVAATARETAALR